MLHMVYSPERGLLTKNTIYSPKIRRYSSRTQHQNSGVTRQEHILLTNNQALLAKNTIFFSRTHLFRQALYSQHSLLSKNKIYSLRTQFINQ